MSELCLLITYSLKVVVAIVVVLMIAWGAVGGFQWWHRTTNEEGYWNKWMKWMMISVIAMVVFLALSVLVPVTVCKPIPTFVY